jgi:hypothetical protein
VVELSGIRPDRDHARPALVVGVGRHVASASRVSEALTGSRDRSPGSCATRPTSWPSR